jgi:methionyl-tRNA formyltransferase
MPSEIVLLWDTMDAQELAEMLLRANSQLAISHVETKNALTAHYATPLPGRRLVAFCTSVTVPDTVLDTVAVDAYSFHSGPPAYPGLYPACFAIYDGPAQFGSTCHALTPDIDGGPIIDINTVEIAPYITRLDLEALSRKLVTRLFITMAPALATVEGRLPEKNIGWRGKPARQADFDALCLLPADVSKDEFDRRYRAVWEGPFHGLKVDLFGHTFRLEPTQGDGVVYKGGRAVST